MSRWRTTTETPSYDNTNQNVFNFFSIIVGALGVAAFILVLLSKDDINRLTLQLPNQQIEDLETLLNSTHTQVVILQQQLTQKCVEVLELQILANATTTTSVGVSVGYNSVDGDPIVANQSISFTSEYWDDANFWSLNDTSSIFIPSDGRYAIGVVLIQQMLSLPILTAQVTLRSTAIGGGSGIFFLRLPVPAEIVSSDSSLYIYFEEEIQKQTDNALGFEVDVNMASFVEIRMSVRKIGPMTGPGITVESPGR